MKRVSKSFTAAKERVHKMESIREVAKIAGVSPATVSRVMNGTATVDEEKKQRVLEAIQETGFMTNEVARALFKKSSKIIGIQQQKKEYIRWKVSEKLQRLQEFHLLLYRE